MGADGTAGGAVGGGVEALPGAEMGVESPERGQVEGWGIGRVFL